MNHQAEARKRKAIYVSSIQKRMLELERKVAVQHHLIVQLTQLIPKLKQKLRRVA